MLEQLIRQYLFLATTHQELFDINDINGICNHVTFYLWP